MTPGRLEAVKKALTGHWTAVTTMTAEKKPADRLRYTRALIIIPFFQNRLWFLALILTFVCHLTRAQELLHHSLLRYKHVSLIHFSASVVLYTTKPAELLDCHSETRIPMDN